LLAIGLFGHMAEIVEFGWQESRAMLALTAGVAPANGRKPGSLLQRLDQAVLPGAGDGEGDSGIEDIGEQHLAVA
jgi:hypothetical protein